MAPCYGAARSPNTSLPGSSTARIRLYAGETAIVDACDYDRLRGYAWSYHPKGYAKRQDEVLGTALMHRDVVGAGPDVQVFHVNGNGLDNRRCNLRVVTKLAHDPEVLHRAAEQPRYKGVYRHGLRWRAMITIDGKLRHVGTYPTQEEAATAYAAAVEQSLFR